MTLAAELATGLCPATHERTRGKVVRPMGGDDEEPRVSAAKKLEKDDRPLVERLRVLIREKTKPGGECVKGWQLALAMKHEVDKDFTDALELLKSEGAIVGVRGKGWRVAFLGDPAARKPEPEPEPEQPKEVAGTTLTVINAVRRLACTELWVNMQSMAARLHVPLAEVQHAVAYLKSVGEIRVGRGGKVAPTVQADEALQERPRGTQGLRSGGRPDLVGKTPQKPVETAAASLPALVEPASAPEPRFGMDDAGLLGISVNGAAVQLAPDDITRLEAFIRKTKPIWKGEE